MQIKYGFKLNLLLSTFLFTGVYNADSAYSRSFRTGVELPSVVVNFAVIQELRNREIARLKEEERRIKEAQYKAMQESQGRAVASNNANNYNNSGNYKQNDYVNNQPQKRYPESYNPNVRQNDPYVERQPQQYQGYIEQLPTRQPNQQVWKNPNQVWQDLNIGNEIADKYNSQDSLPSPISKPYSTEKVTSSPLTVAESTENVLDNLLLPRLKPGSEQNQRNESYKDDNEVVELSKEKSPAKEIYFDQMPGSRQSFIKVTEVPRENNADNKTASPNVSYYNFPESEKKEEEYTNRILPKPVINEKSQYLQEPAELSDIPKKLPNKNTVFNDDIDAIESDEFSQYDDYEKELLDVKEVKLYENESELVDDIKNVPNAKNDLPKQPKKSEDISTKSDPVKEDSFISVVNKKVKDLFSFNEGGQAKQEQNKLNIKVSNSNDKVTPQQKPDVIKNEVNETQEIDVPQKINEYKSPEEENKALIPVEVSELYKIVQDYTEDYTKPVDLDGVSNLSDWNVPEDIMKTLDADIKKKNENIAALGNNTNIILPNPVENEQGGKETPKPRVKPLKEEAFDVKKIQKTVIPVVRSSKTQEADNVPIVEKNKKKQEDVAAPAVKNITEEKTQKVSENKQQNVNKVPDVVSTEKKTPIVSPQANIENEKNYDPISDEKWEEALEKARLKALPAQEAEKKEEVDLSKFKSLLKKDKEEEKVEAEAEVDLKRSPSSNPVESDELSSSEELKQEDTEQKAPEQTVTDSDGILYLEDIAKTLKKNKHPNDVVINRSVLGSSSVGSVNGNSTIPSKVTELVGNRIVVPSSEMELLNTTNIAATPKSEGLLKIDFNEDQLDLTESDNKKINKLVEDIKDSNKKVAIVSYASSNKIENARRISLKRAIAVRSAMLEAGLTSDMVHVQAAGVAEKKQDENSVKISFAN
ncbi:MAG: OmpA family protein [Rickettsiales bacterium]|nr:OmpA family protein [Pseudomonadota bacterium]MDA0966781.1 OmpA family protein [Pseudomonadota bacterium]MDG4543453.1 OmpA family protein [Rickettsiales bacterium]MDG4546153.1 OmpA family protein [Rickettsiales bacterium]MDG4547626.1 OmpA family protein [Rickettsiales bacterium]